MSPHLFDRRLLVVTGKGGVGRTTLSAALAVAAGRAGRRTLVLELSGAGGLPSHFGLGERAFQYRRATDNVWVASFTVQECLHDFARRKLRLSGILARVVHARPVATFVDAVPGLHDILQLGKLENLLNEPLAGDPVFDLVVLDAPATGHGLTLLSAARSLTEIAKAGPFYELASIIDRFLQDPVRTAIVVATLPEALPVSETGELVQALRADGFDPALLIANRCDPAPLPDGSDVDAIADRVRAVPDGQGLAELLIQAEERHQAQQQALAPLRDARIPLVELPRLRTPDLARALGDTLHDALVEAP
jgi:anion-transporting  ArsA/GET3 family ATPase